MAAAVTAGTAGWSIPRGWAEAFPGEGSHLQRYAERFAGVEINSSFHRPHRQTTYRRWADCVPDAFRFAVKLPRQITHTQRLRDVEQPLAAFLAEISGLGGKLGPLLVQLPPSLSLEPDVAGAFFSVLRAQFDGAAVCEPRHASWFDESGEALLARFAVARVAADPARVPQASEPGGSPDLAYFRLHGSPRVYYSSYEPERMETLAAAVLAAAGRAKSVWCMFDNTTLGAATRNALDLVSRVRSMAPGCRLPRV